MRLPDEDEVVLWVIDLARTQREQSVLGVLLSSAELRRAAEMRVEAARRRFVCARASLRALLATYVGGDPSELELVEGPYGKPKLAPPALSFNLAHSGELALVAVAARAEVGVDLELMRPREDPLRVARRYFTASEFAALEGAEGPRREALFYELWVAKEAFVKATGRGLAASLRSFQVQLEPPPPRLVQVAGDELEAARWSLDLPFVASGYAAAVVTAGALRRSPVNKFEPEALASAAD